MLRLLKRVPTAFLTAGITFGLAASLDRALNRVDERHPAVSVPAPVNVVTAMDGEKEKKYPEATQVEFGDEDELTYNGYRIRREYKRVKVEPGLWVDASYVVVEKQGMVVAKLDAGIYGGYGNSTSFALVPLLGGDSKQLVVSQDVSRGGTQWIVSLWPRFQIIFNGQELGVGREGPDLGIVDLDHDGVYEITAPITDFYEFQDKMSISQIPLPTIVFKYDRTQNMYLPANPLFADYTSPHVGEDETGIDDSDQFSIRSGTLGVLLAYIYTGREDDGWDFFNRTYHLPDKEEMRGRVKSNLKDQPVYKYICK